MAERRYYEGLGRRKRATARVRIYHGGEGQILINGKNYQEYFGRQFDWRHVVSSFKVTQTEELFDVTVQVKGGGITGQSEAVLLGTARALLKYDPELRPVLRKAGFLTRDAREKERKKPGLRGARRATQYTKR
ncbi:MAG TPA: 30S ribosomal protein S9 [Thermoflexia bacterium]|nr:30S ribosomal protein S9 [Thermoflexia bacterium]